METGVREYDTENLFNGTDYSGSDFDHSFSDEERRAIEEQISEAQKKGVKFYRVEDAAFVFGDEPYQVKSASFQKLESLAEYFKHLEGMKVFLKEFMKFPAIDIAPTLENQRLTLEELLDKIRKEPESFPKVTGYKVRYAYADDSLTPEL